MLIFPCLARCCKDPPVFCSLRNGPSSPSQKASVQELCALGGGAGNRRDCKCQCVNYKISSTEIKALAPYVATLLDSINIMNVKMEARVLLMMRNLPAMGNGHYIKNTRLIRLKADLNLWMKICTREAANETKMYYSYILVYLAGTLCIHDDLESILRKLDKFFPEKPW